MVPERLFNLLKFLKDEIPLIGDGPVEILLREKGLPLNLTPLQANLEYPDLVSQMHQTYIRNGAQLIRTNSAFSMKENWKFLHSRKEALFNSSTSLARKSSIGPAIIAGRITGLPSNWDETARLQFYGEQAIYLSDTKVELLWLEDFSGTNELLLALEAILQVSKVQTVVHLNLQPEYSLRYVIEQLKMLINSGATFAGISLDLDENLLDSFVVPAIDQLGILSLILNLNSTTMDRKKLKTMFERIIHFEAAILCGGRGFEPELIKIINNIKIL